ncbi:hypothetical protein ACH5RR_015999 [Cinchona calisaya]|uniref:Uncharacterized protein n=1 Tax=Cinchona calisaya TaxID=153742 RepID=A0ABD2ZXT3_9GENT
MSIKSEQKCYDLKNYACGLGPYPASILQPSLRAASLSGALQMNFTSYRSIGSLEHHCYASVIGKRFFSQVIGALTHKNDTVGEMQSLITPLEEAVLAMKHLLLKAPTRKRKTEKGIVGIVKYDESLVVSSSSKISLSQKSQITGETSLQGHSEFPQLYPPIAKSIVMVDFVMKVLLDRKTSGSVRPEDDFSMVDKMFEKEFSIFLFAFLPNGSRTCPSYLEVTSVFKVSKFGAGCSEGMRVLIIRYTAKTHCGKDEEEVVLKMSKFGSYIQIGEDREGFLPEREKDLDSVTLEFALELLCYPMTLKMNPDTVTFEKALELLNGPNTTQVGQPTIKEKLEKVENH